MDIPIQICDALAKDFSRNLCREYPNRFDRILHHNVDKALLCGGRAKPEFGGGSLLAPIEIFLAGRAVSAVGGETIPIDELAGANSSIGCFEYILHEEAGLSLNLQPSRPQSQRADADNKKNRRNPECFHLYSPRSRAEMHCAMILSASRAALQPTVDHVDGQTGQAHNAAMAPKVLGISNTRFDSEGL